jgi:hypothetical protein
MYHQLIGNCWPTEDRLLLLKAALLPDHRAVQAWEAWLQRNESSFEIVDEPSYQLYPLVYRNLEKLNVAGAVFDKCKGIYRRNWTFNQVMWRKLDYYFDQLKSNGIQKIVLLKGMAMVAGHYHDFGVRVMGDIDALIAIDEVPKVDQILRQYGLKNEGAVIDIGNPYELCIHHAVHYRIDNETFLDLHWAFLSESPFTGLDREVLKYAEKIEIHGKAFYIPDPTTLLLQTCVHGVKSTQVASLRWITDAVTLLRYVDIDWARLQTMARCARVTLPLSNALYYLNQHLDVALPMNILDELAKEVVSQQEKFEYWCNIHGYFFVVNWLQYCARRGYQSWAIRLWNFPRFIQYRRRLPSLWHVIPCAFRWIKRRYKQLG